MFNMIRPTLVRLKVGVRTMLSVFLLAAVSICFVSRMNCTVHFYNNRINSNNFKCILPTIPPTIAPAGPPTTPPRAAPPAA